MTREVREVRWVRVLTERPSVIPQGRPQGAKRAGVRYEAALAAGPLREAAHGVWLEFTDANGHGFAQVDFLRESFTAVAFEAKLTWTPAAYVQLRRLYLPLLRHLRGGPVGGVVVCQNLTRDTPRRDVTSDLAEALGRAACGEVPVLHLPLVPKEPRRAAETPARSRVPPWWKKAGGERAPRRADGA